MSEPVDVYSDHFLVSVGPYGASLTFSLSSAHPEQTSPKPPERVATIRMSIEHLKMISMVINRHVKKMEGELGVSYQVPVKLLSGMGIAPEDWSSFWAQ